MPARLRHDRPFCNTRQFRVDRKGIFLAAIILTPVTQAPAAPLGTFGFLLILIGDTDIRARVYGLGGFRTVRTGRLRLDPFTMEDSFEGLWFCERWN